MDKLADIQDINAIPFAKVMEMADITPVLFNCFVPALDLVIWKMRLCQEAWTTEQFRDMALGAFDHAIEADIREPGVIVSERDGYSFFVFPSKLRTEILKEMGIEEPTAQ